jgi:hypothetical protein
MKRVAGTTIAEQIGERQVELNPKASSVKSRKWRSRSRSIAYAVVSGGVILTITITDLALIILEVKII